MDDEIIILTDDKLENAFVDDAFKMYMREIRRYPNLSVEQQQKLGHRYKENGDLKARELLINCNLRLVVSVAYHYRLIIKHLQILDVIQEGNFGLIRAVETYDPEQGAFTTYAFFWISQKIIRGLANKDDVIRKPVHIVQTTYKYLGLVENYNQKGLPLPSDKDICDTLNITIGTLKKIRDSLKQNPVSLNQTIDDEDKSELEKFVTVENHDYDNILNQIVNDNLLSVLKEVLSPLYYFVIYYRILSDEQKTLKVVASYLNITGERVRKIEAYALKKIKPYMVEDSSVFTSVLNKIKQREGYKFYSLRKTPLSPTQINRYMYLKDDLTDLERKLYQLNLLGKYKYRNADYASILKITLPELNQVMTSLKAKYNKKFSDARSFKYFQEQMIKNYGTGIFDIDINKKEKIIDYRALEERYSSLSLEEIVSYFNDVNYNLTHDEETLLNRYFGVCNWGILHPRVIEREVNVLIFGFRKKSKQVPLKKLYKEYIRIMPKFTEEQQLYLESYFFGKKNRKFFDINYPNSILYRHDYFLIEKLERSYYHIYEYFENNFTKENWLEIKNKYWEQFSDEKIEYLDLYYGVKGKIYSIPEIAEMFQMEYIKMHDIIRDARDLAIHLFSGIKRKIEIDKELYIPYIEDLHYDFTKETRDILKLFIIEGKSYDEISKITSLNKTRISNIITDGIRKIDNFRFEISQCFIIDDEELNNFFEYYNNKITPVEKKILRLKHINHMENKDIAPIVGKTLQEVNSYVRRFNVLYKNYMIRDVVLTDNDIADEIARHKSESIWSEEDKEFASFYFGIQSVYNPTGLKLKMEELMKKMGYSKHTYYHIYINMIKLLKARKIDFVKPDNNYISREKLDKLLDDVHLPISDKEREIICYLFELKGYPYKNIEELTSIFGDNKGSIKRRYQRAIVSIYKYLNHEIEGSIHFETDIVPILKYFCVSDRMKIEDFYKSGMTYEEMATKYKTSYSKIDEIMNRIKINVYELMNNLNAKKFDFDYYLEAIKDPDLPFLGDLQLAVQIFDLVFGMNGEERINTPLVIEKLGLDYGETTIHQTIINLMLSVCRLKDGIKRDKTFSFEQVYSYYINNCENMSLHHRKLYQTYFKKVKNQKNINNLGFSLSNKIIYDLIEANYSDIFKLKNASREEVLELIKKFGKELSRGVRTELMGRFGIREREFMNGRDINHVFKMLHFLDVRRKELDSQFLKLEI